MAIISVFACLRRENATVCSWPLCMHTRFHACNLSAQLSASGNGQKNFTARCRRIYHKVDCGCQDWDRRQLVCIHSQSHGVQGLQQCPLRRPQNWGRRELPASVLEELCICPLSLTPHYAARVHELNAGIDMKLDVMPWTVIPQEVIPWGVYWIGPATVLRNTKYAHWKENRTPNAKLNIIERRRAETRLKGRQRPDKSPATRIKIADLTYVLSILFIHSVPLKPPIAIIKHPRAFCPGNLGSAGYCAIGD